MATRATRVDEVAPQRIVGCEHLAGSKPGPPARRITACDLRRQREEELVNQTRRQEIGRETWTSLKQDQIKRLTGHDQIEDPAWVDLGCLSCRGHLYR